MSFSQLKDLMPKAAGKYQLQGELHAAMIVNRASTLLKELFSEELVKLMRVKRFKDGVVWVAVQHAIAAQELQQRSAEILEALNQGFEKSPVKQLRSFQETPNQDPFSLS